ncbi:VOC family protein [Parashewanella tropica]|uniref:VOC family protein n=1 Tax=Parashewanella tropica TaxID=2547970 RepID=UPI001059D959|nr:hydroxylase [Parashewanella tropica]
MKESTKIHYLEVVTSDAEQVCSLYSKSLNILFSDVIPELGNARTATLSNGSLLGIRAPMHDAEEPTTRPYYLTDDIELAVSEAEKLGADVMVPPMDIPERGKCAIVLFGTIQSGFWQV